MPPKVCVLRAPGTNCDPETAHAFELAGAEADIHHLFALKDSPELLKEYQILCLPGGFSYGDDIGAGVVFGNQLRLFLNDALNEFLHKDSLILGICNGFQVLLKSGILPGGATSWQQQAPRETTLTWNDNGKYTARWVRLTANPESSVFLKGLETLELPMAHAEGRFTTTPETMQDLLANQQCALKYTDETGVDSAAVLEEQHNPNGSLANLAGLSDATGRVLGLMPHPERFIHHRQHPAWTRQRDQKQAAGLTMFQNAVNYFAAS